MFKKYIIAFLGLFLAFWGLESNATALVDTTSVDAAFVDLTDTVSYFEGKAWPLVFLVTGITLGIGMFKRFTRMSAR